ncbi:MAG TPA: glycosyltransferase family 4 protein [Blastocatellia bacterium]|nr:glycosyltransferase family 4 protein [Blastocatellia bacterium]
MSSKRLLICSPSHALRGGVESIINDLCREIGGRGWEPLLGLGKGSRFNDVAAYRSAYADLPIVEIDGTKGTRQGRLEALESVIKRVQPDVVMSARIFDAYDVVTSLKQRQGSPRLAVTIRGFEPNYLFDARVYKDNIDLCVVDGKLLAAACVGWCGLNESRVVSIPGGIRPSKSAIEPRQSLPIMRIGYVGRLSQSDKRVLDLVPLVRSLDEQALGFHLRIVGEGPEELALREQLERFVLDARVTFHRWKTHEQLYGDVYPNLDCIVNFSPAEGVTISGREAMAHGVVPVMSRFVGMQSEGFYVHELNALTFPVGDITTATMNIIRLKNEPGLLNRLSKRAAASQTGRYTYEGAIEAWAEAFDRCLEQPPALGPMPRLALPPDGRLARIGLSPRIAQMTRDFLGRRHVHDDPGSEWPTGSGLIDQQTADEIMQFATNYESKANKSNGKVVS